MKLTFNSDGVDSIQKILDAVRQFSFLGVKKNIMDISYIGLISLIRVKKNLGGGGG